MINAGPFQMITGISFPSGDWDSLTVTSIYSGIAFENWQYEFVGVPKSGFVPVEADMQKLITGSVSGQTVDFRQIPVVAKGGGNFGAACGAPDFGSTTFFQPDNAWHTASGLSVDTGDAPTVAQWMFDDDGYKWRYGSFNDASIGVIPDITCNLLSSENTPDPGFIVGEQFTLTDP